MPLLIVIVTALFMLGKAYLNESFLPPPPDYSFSGCEPHLEYDTRLNVNVDDNLLTYYNDVENKTWVLIKRRVPVPAWKIIRTKKRYRIGDGKELEEMEKVGKVSNATTPADNDKDVYIGIGHCSGTTDPDSPPCLDPLVQDTVYVLQEEGYNQKPLPYWALPIYNKEDGPNGRQGTNEKNHEGFYWYFDLYLDLGYFSRLTPAPPDPPTDDDLPCWTKLACGAGDVLADNRKKAWEDYMATGICNPPGAPTPTTDPLNPQSQDTFHPLFADQTPAMLYKNEIIFDDPDFDASILEDTYIYLQTSPTDPQVRGAVKIGSITTRSPHLEIYYLASDTLLFASPLPDKNSFYTYQPITSVLKPTARSLQLGTFKPESIAVGDYEWWTPACKPALYFYPPKPLDLNIKVKPLGKITESIPDHGENGWHILASPDGKITSYSSPQSPVPSPFPYLYYEAQIEKVKKPRLYWQVAKEALPGFFTTVLQEMKFNEKEIADFLAYWLVKLSSDQSWEIGLISPEEVNRTEPVTFSTAPDTFIRARFYFRKNTFPHPKQNPKEIILDWDKTNWASFKQIFLAPFPKNRAGFTVMDWGGMIESGDCTLPVKVE